MENEITVSPYLDTRRKKRNDKYPIKFCVYDPSDKSKKYYGSKFELTETEFLKFYPKVLGKAPTGDRLFRQQIEAERLRIENIANSLQFFNFSELEQNLLFTKNGVTAKCIDVFNLYQIIIDSKKKSGNIGTASNYECSLNSLKKFHKKDVLKFESVSKEWLMNYEKFMVEINNYSRTTVGIYLRPLRAVFNEAIERNLINIAVYPFTKKKYVIPSPKRAKKALSKNDLKKLFECKPETPSQQKAKDFWFFSYSCNGMNFKDIAYIKFKNINDDVLRFDRAKTIHTTQEQKQIDVYLTDFAKDIINKYGNPNKNKEQYIFNDIVNHSDTPEERHRQLKNFIRFVNQHIKKLADLCEISSDISTYWARHSFTTNAINNGAGMEFVMEALGHSNMKTTKGYFAGFENETKKDISRKIMDF